MRESVVPKTQADRKSTWAVWVRFTRSMEVDPYLHLYDGDKLHFFIVFAMRYRRGQLAKNRKHNPVTGKRVEEALRAIGTQFTLMGEPDPRLTSGQKYVGRLRMLFQNFSKADPAADRRAPCCLTILRALPQVLKDQDKGYADAVTDLSVMAFYFLCRPGEYAKSTADEPGRSTPFRLKDVSFGTNTRKNLNAATCSLHDVRQSTYVSLLFTDQKNCVKGETVGHRSSGDARWCPVRALARRVEYLRLANAPADTPLFTYYDRHSQPKYVTTLDITNCLRQAAKAVFHTTGIPPSKITGQSLRSGGATALLCANWDRDKVQLLGRWQSDAMLRYLRLQAMQITSQAAKAMLQHGCYTFHPDTKEHDLDSLPQETPTPLLNVLQAGILA